MRIFIAGATGTLGRPVVRRLVSLGHEVVGLTRSEKGARALAAAGAKGVIGDALDREGLRAAVVAARPEQVLHLLTALPRLVGCHPNRGLRFGRSTAAAGTSPTSLPVRQPLAA